MMFAQLLRQPELQSGTEYLVNLDMSYFTNQCFLNLLVETLLIANTSCFLLVPGSGLYPATPAISPLASSM